MSFFCWRSKNIPDLFTLHYTDSRLSVTVYHTGAVTVARGAASSPASCARAAGGRRPPWDRQQAGAGSVRTVPGSPRPVWWTPWSPGWTLSWRTLRTSRTWRSSYKGNVVFIIFQFSWDFIFRFSNIFHPHHCKMIEIKMKISKSFLKHQMDEGKISFIVSLLKSD